MRTSIQSHNGRTGPHLASTGRIAAWLVAAAAMAAAPCTRASVWTGGSGDWSSNGDPGWNGTGVPNGIGAVASFDGSAAGTSSQDITAGVTVGTIELLGTAAGTRSVAPTNALTLNQDGAGAGFAILSNANTSTGAARLSLSNVGTVTLADDLLIRNTSASTGSYSISITSKLDGTGNVTFSNVSNSATVAPINLGAGNSFTGSVWVQKGAVTLANPGLGGVGNAVTLGSAGNSATLMTTGSSTALPNNITVAVTSGTNLLGSNSTSATSNSTFSGTIELNGDLTITSSKASGAETRFTNSISGAGALTKIGSGDVSLSGSNSYQGGTTISQGTLRTITGLNPLGSGAVTVDGSTAILELDTATSIADDAAVSLLNGGTIQLKFADGQTEVIGGLVLGSTVFNTPVLFSQADGFVVNGTDYSSYFAGSDAGTSLQVVPEPTSLSLLAAALAGLCARRRRKTP